MTVLVSAWQDPNVGLQERIQWIITNRFGGNASEMSRRCGLTRSHVNLILKKRRQGDAAPRILDDTARKIAAASGVTTQWLLDGTWPRDVTEVSPATNDQYPARARAASAARLLGVGEEAIQYVLSIAYRSSIADQMTPEDWFDKMKAADKDFKRGWLPEEVRTAEPDTEFYKEPPINKLLDAKKRARNRAT